MNPGRKYGLRWRSRAVGLVHAVFLSGAAALMGLNAPVHAQEASSFREYDVKAVFLLNFMQFVEWPETRLAETNTPFVIGVLGTDPFGSILDQTVRGERIHGRLLVVRRFAQVDDVSPCHLLFVCRSERNRMADIIRRVSGRGILTVGDIDPFSRLGGMITFKTSKNRVQFEINVAAAQKEGLRLSAKLLKVAQLVSGEP